MLRLKRLSAETEISAAESISRAALKQTAPDAAESIQMPIKSPAAAEVIGLLNIAKAVSRGRIISGAAFLILISIISV